VKSAPRTCREDEIRAELNGILDPCSVVAGAPAGIDEMGLIRRLTVTDARGGVAVGVRIGVTEPGCMMGASFAIKARERLEALPGVVAADIDPAYAERLAAVRASRSAPRAPASPTGSRPRFWPT